MIQKHGEDDDFVNSLEYYTTCRVKHAFLRMNAQSIVDRISEVHSKISKLHALLTTRHALDAFAPAFVIPNAPPPTESGDLEDPNAICFPQDEDYEVECGDP